MAKGAEFLVVWWIVSVWIVNLSNISCQDCMSPAPVGPGVVANRTNYTTDNSNDALFLIANGHSIGCYGVVVKWSFKSAQDLESISCYTSIAQIWRPSPSDPLQYLLVGENTLFDMDLCNTYLSTNASDYTEFSLSVPPSSQIPVQPGDVMAWHDIGFADGDRKIGFDRGLPASTYMSTVYVLPNSSSCNPSVGLACSWPASSIVGRNYGIEINLAIGRTPVILNLPKTISIDELLPVGTFLFKVEANNNFTWNPTITPPLDYSISSTSSATCASWFAIDQLNGSVSVANSFNILMTASFNCTIDVKVMQFGGTLENTSSLTITVMNVNEPHEIGNLPRAVTMDSAIITAASHSIYTVNVSDPDLTYFDTTIPKSFYIIDISPPYSIFEIITSVTAGKIQTTRSLDDWTGPDVFNINVTVSDTEFVAGPKTLTFTLTNIIQPPVLLNLNATITLDETRLPGTVYTVKSSTDPTRTTTIVEYAIISQIPYSGVGSYPFSISSTLGTVTLNSALDYLAVKQYAIEIQATSTYQTAILVSKPRTLIVDVKWIDRAPTISITPTVTEMSEDVVVGTPVPGITITTTDREYDNNFGDYLVFIVSDPHFVVDNVTKMMYTSGSLFILPPAKCSQTYALQVFVQDSYGKSDSSRLNVTVTRANRESPTFSQAQFNGSVQANGTGGSSTKVTLSAADPDCGNNETITYSILGEIANLYFQVDPTSGVITQKQSISQPTYPNMTFTVMASDGGQPSLNSTAIVFIVVNAVNAHAPWFAHPSVVMETRSDSPVGSSIYTLNVTDPDSANVNDIRYEIVVLQDDFDVKSSGDIVPKRKLSSFKRYTLYVIATDTGQGMNYFTDPETVVIDTYDAARQLINIEMLRPLSETDPKLPEFMGKLNDFLKPWTVKMEDLKYDGDNTVVTIYAYDSAGTFSSEPTPKHFIDRDDLLAKLRTDIYGTPVDGLRGPEFEDYEIVSVDPAYPVWVLDTVEGIATLTVVSVVALALIVTTIVLLLKYFKMACFRKDKVGPAPQKNEPIKGELDGEEFQLSYANTHPYETKTTDATMFDVEPFERPPTYKANTPPLRPDADLEL